jgi:hypothetical protein
MDELLAIAIETNKVLGEIGEILHEKKEELTLG